MGSSVAERRRWRDGDHVRVQVGGNVGKVGVVVDYEPERMVGDELLGEHVHTDQYHVEFKHADGDVYRLWYRGRELGPANMT